MKKIKINDKEYEVVENYKDGLDTELLNEYLTDYFDDYDYVLGDFAYGKLRLKGFYDKKNKKVKDINNFANIKDYIKNYCAYECKYFIIKRLHLTN